MTRATAHAEKKGGTPLCEEGRSGTSPSGWRVNQEHVRTEQSRLDSRPWVQPSPTAPREARRGAHPSHQGKEGLERRC